MKILHKFFRIFTPLNIFNEFRETLPEEKWIHDFLLLKEQEKWQKDRLYNKQFDYLCIKTVPYKYYDKFNWKKLH